MNTAALINEAFPDLKIRSLKKIGNGKACDVFLANNEIVFKIPLVPASPYSCLQVEYNALTALYGKTSMAIPQPLLFGNLPDGRLILGMSYLPGLQFTQELYESLSQPNKDIVFADIGEFLYQIHVAGNPKVDGIPTSELSQNIGYFHKNYQAIVMNKLTDTEQQRIDDIYNKYLTIIKSTTVPLVLNHGDIHFWNMNFNPATNRICGFYDFGEANYADPMEDMCYYWPFQVEKILQNYPAKLSETTPHRHLFYCISNIISEAYAELTNTGKSDYINYLKQVISK